MENELREKLIIEINRIDARCAQLKEFFNEYKKEDNFTLAMQTQIKWKQLELVSKNLKKILL